MIAVSFRGIFAVLASAASIAIGCHTVAGVDYEITQASSGGAAPLGQTTATTGAATDAASTTAGPASTSASASEASSSSSGPVGECVPSLFHVSFDTDDPAQWNFFVKSGPGAHVEEPTRRGAGAWRVALEPDETRGSMQWSSGEKGEEYWMGFSALHQGPAIESGTRLSSIFCSYGSPTYQETQAVALEMLVATPSFPFAAFGLSRDLVGATADGFDHLDNIQETVGTWSDWVLHFKITDDETGFLEIFHGRTGTARTKVFRAVGYLFDDACQDSLFLRWGLSRWALAPPQEPDAQAAVIDEIRLIRVNPDAPDPPAEIDYLHTLDPDSSCDAAP